MVPLIPRGRGVARLRAVATPARRRRRVGFPESAGGCRLVVGGDRGRGHKVGWSRQRGVASRLALDVPHVGIGASGRGLCGDGNESVACGRLGCRTELFAVDISGQAPGTARRMVGVPCRRRRGHRRGRPQPASDDTAVSARRMFRSECCNLRWRCPGPHLERAYETPGRRRSLSLRSCVTPDAGTRLQVAEHLVLEPADRLGVRS